MHPNPVANRKSERLEKLLIQNRLKKRGAELAKIWSTHGVAVSPLAHDRYWKVIERIRGQLRWLERPTDEVVVEVRAFAGKSDVLTMIGWNVRKEPALLVSASKLIAHARNLTEIYPDGFILISDTIGKALIVDIDDHEGTRFDIAELPDTAT